MIENLTLHFCYISFTPFSVPAETNSLQVTLFLKEKVDLTRLEIEVYLYKKYSLNYKAYFFSTQALEIRCYVP